MYDKSTHQNPIELLCLHNTIRVNIVSELLEVETFM